MDERKRLAVALGLPAMLLAAMLFAPLDAVARPDSASGPQAGLVGPIVSGASEPPLLAPRRSTPAPAVAVSNDWADVLQVDGVTYTAGLLNPGRALRESDLGNETARVRSRLNGNVRPVGYVLKDGDAAYLDPGTPLYAMNGYRSTFRLAARREGRLVLFEAIANPNARSGRDLLDIEGKVTGISVDVLDPRGVGRSVDPNEVPRLVGMILDARVDPAATFGKRAAYLSLRLLDGTIVSFQYSEETASLSRGITGLPRDFMSAIANRT